VMSVWSKAKEALDSACTNGLKFPFAHDPVTKKPSVTLLSYYLGLYMSVGSLIYLHIKSEPIIATSATILFWVLTYIFYRIRKLDSAKISLEDKSIELKVDKD
jgi:hypothetical protein